MFAQLWCVFVVDPVGHTLLLCVCGHTDEGRHTAARARLANEFVVQVCAHKQLLQSVHTNKLLHTW
jgi:hypothetical protein